MKKYFNETYIKIGVIGFMIIGVIFLGSYQKANSGFNISDMSIVNSQEKFEPKESEIPINQNEIPINSNANSTIPLNVSIISTEIERENNSEKILNKSSLEEKNVLSILPVTSTDVNEKHSKSEKIEDVKSNDGIDKLKSIDLNNTQLVVEGKNINEAEKNIIEIAENKNAEIVQEKESPVAAVVKTEKENSDIVKAEEKIVVQINSIEDGKKEETRKSDESVAEEDSKEILQNKENKETKQNESFEKKIEATKNLQVNTLEKKISYFNLLIVIFTIIINLMVYYYVYQHLSTNITQNISGLKKEFIELEQSFSYRSITDI